MKEYANPNGDYSRNDADTKWRYLLATGHELHHFEAPMRERRRREIEAEEEAEVCLICTLL